MKRSMLPFLAFFSLAGAFGLSCYLDQNKISEKSKLLYVLPRSFVEVISGTHKPFVADLIYLKALQFVGERNPAEGVRALDKRAVEYLLGNLRVVSALDPKFISPYFVGGIVITYDKMSARSAISYLQEGMHELPDEWRLPFWIGFNYYHQLDSPDKAVGFFSAASKKPSAPDFLQRIQPMVYYRAGRPEAGVAYLEGLQASLSDPEMGRWIQKKLDWLRLVVSLEKTVGDFHELFGRYPKNLEELVDVGLLDAVPKDPFGKRFFLEVKTARVQSVFGEYRSADSPALLFYSENACELCPKVNALISGLEADYGIKVEYRTLRDQEDKALLESIQAEHGSDARPPLVVWQDRVYGAEDILRYLEASVRAFLDDRSMSGQPGDNSSSTTGPLSPPM